jgi:flavin reductase (DIM6/NTAB) family NADH-FMN oxidoreductase RutF
MTDTFADPQDFRDAMSQFASGVTVVTTRGADGAPVGFTASAFSSLSLDPPLVLVCLARSAESFPAFQQASTMSISILAVGQDDIALRFATRGADKFGETSTTDGTTNGMPLVDEATAHVECRIRDRLDGGDHVILVGAVTRAATAPIEPLLHYNRAFGHFVVS